MPSSVGQGQLHFAVKPYTVKKDLFMAVPVLDPSSFFSALRKAGLLSDTEMDKAKRACEGVSDPSAIARKLVNVSLLSAWQANQILRGREDYSLRNYSLLDQVAIDDFGETFVARHDGMNRRARIRTFSSPRPLTSEGSAEFIQEAQRVAALDHPNIVHVYDVDQVNGRYFLVMEDIAGENLARLVTSQRPLPPALAAEVICQAAAGLAYAHEQGVIHGNLTPKHLVQIGDRIKVIDFALPQLARANNMDSATIIDPDYAAPELAVDGTPLDHRCDIYSLGCILYYLLTGRPPFAAGTREERLRAHAEQEPPAIEVLRPDVPKHLARICRKMMAKDPAQRFSSAAQVSEYLSKWLDSQKVVESPAVPLRQVTPISKPLQEAALSESSAGASALPRIAIQTDEGGAGLATAARRRKTSYKNAFLGPAVLLVVCAVIYLGYVIANMDEDASQQPKPEAGSERSTLLGKGGYGDDEIPVIAEPTGGSIVSSDDAAGTVDQPGPRQSSNPGPSNIDRGKVKDSSAAKRTAPRDADPKSSDDKKGDDDSDWIPGGKVPGGEPAPEAGPDVAQGTTDSYFQKAKAAVSRGDIPGMITNLEQHLATENPANVSGIELLISQAKTVAAPEEWYRNHIQHESITLQQLENYKNGFLPRFDIVLASDTPPELLELFKKLADHMVTVTLVEMYQRGELSDLIDQEIARREAEANRQ
ncbi:MAG: serine/threonine-protein kinase [Pirellulales bacterium]